MNISDFINTYIGTPYCLHNLNGLNCWGLVAQYYDAVHNTELPIYEPKSTYEIANTFTAAFANGDHGFKKCINKAKDGDVIVFKSSKGFHCGLYYKGKVLHSSGRTFGVALQQIKDVYGYKEHEFWEPV